jgi:hypothetical protein
VLQKETQWQRFVSAFIIGLALLTQTATAQTTISFTPEDLRRRTVERRAVDAVIWGLPLVGEDAVKQAYFRDHQGAGEDDDGGKAETVGAGAAAAEEVSARDSARESFRFVQLKLVYRLRSG